ncbi:MAG: hypothetical protein JNM25_13515 [Planctomycetes bacterium]|nr:hypothetical protein [Planctomycetota bacterium]
MHSNVARGARGGFVWVAAAVAIVLVVALRNPDLLTSPRFWGEEGELFYQPACTGSLWHALTACPQDYYNLGCRLATLLALAVPIERAPLVTTVFALLVQVLPGLLILRLAQQGAFRPWTAAVAIAAVLLGSPMHETWLTSTSSAYYFLLAGAVTIVFYEALGLRATAWCIALATGLSSTYAIGLLPFAAWLAVRQPSRGRTIATLLLLLGLLVQTVIYLTNDSGVARTSDLPPAIAVAAFFAKVYVLPVGGLGVADRVGVELSWAIYEERFWRWTPLLLLPVVAMWAAVLASGSRTARQLFVCGHLLAVTALFGSLGQKHELIGGLAGGRYFVPISALHMLGTLEALRPRSRWWVRLLPAVFLGATLLQGVRQYFDLPPGFFQGPDWRAEVAAWRRDPSHAMATWPANAHWRVRLPPP